MAILTEEQLEKLIETHPNSLDGTLTFDRVCVYVTPPKNDDAPITPGPEAIQFKGRMFVNYDGTTVEVSDRENFFEDSQNGSLLQFHQSGDVKVQYLIDSSVVFAIPVSGMFAPADAELVVMDPSGTIEYLCGDTSPD